MNQITLTKFRRDVSITQPKVESLFFVLKSSITMFRSMVKSAGERPCKTIKCLHNNIKERAGDVIAGSTACKLSRWSSSRCISKECQTNQMAVRSSGLAWVTQSLPHRGYKSKTHVSLMAPFKWQLVSIDAMFLTHTHTHTYIYIHSWIYSLHRLYIVSTTRLWWGWMVMLWIQTIDAGVWCLISLLMAEGCTCLLRGSWRIAAERALLSSTWPVPVLRAAAKAADMTPPRRCVKSCNISPRNSLTTVFIYSNPWYYQNSFLQKGLHLWAVSKASHYTDIPQTSYSGKHH